MTIDTDVNLRGDYLTMGAAPERRVHFVGLQVASEGAGGEGLMEFAAQQLLL